MAGDGEPMVGLRARLLLVVVLAIVPALLLTAWIGRTVTDRLVLLTGGALAVVALAAAATDLFVLRRVRHLVGATHRLADGAFSVRTGPPYGRDELGHLARALDEMAVALERRESEAAQTATILQRSLDELRRTDEERRRLLAHLSTVQEQERARIASDIHDDSIQVMTAVGLRLETLRRRLASNPEHLRALGEVEASVIEAIGRLRHLLFELRPPVLDREGLAPALRVTLEELSADGSLDYELDNRLSGEPPEEVRRLLYRIAHEALANVQRHARARAVSVLLEEREGGFYVRIADDGRGFSLRALGPGTPGTAGLTAMRERAELSGGWCRLSSSPGAGTTVETWLPQTAVLVRTPEEILA